MSSIQMLRAILVGGAAVAAVFAAAYQLWFAVAVLLVAVVVHGYLSLYLRRPRDERSAGDVVGDAGDR